MIKKYLKFTITCCLLLTGFSCTEYLEKTPSAQVTDEQIFSDYLSFQGFVDQMYALMVDYNSHALTTSMCIGGEAICRQGWGSANKALQGRYLDLLTSNFQSNFRTLSVGDDLGQGDSGIWVGSWRGIRIANTALSRLELLKDATPEEKALIEGQIKFFRGFFHWEIVRAFGKMPYIDKFLQPEDDLLLPVLPPQEVLIRAAKDLDDAAQLLPENWDNTIRGQALLGSNTGRATKGAALTFKAKALLYAGSPLFNLYSGGDASYVPTLIQQAADAAAEVIKIADKGVYKLVPFENYLDNFAKNDGTMPWTSETIWQKVKYQVGANEMTSRHGRVFSPSRFGGNNINETPNQLYVDRYEMADGTKYKQEYDNDNTKRWENRDPRMRFSIMVDGDKVGDKAGTAQFYKGGADDNSNTITCYFVKKFWPYNVNNKDNQWQNFRYVTPHARLAEVYLIYAEALAALGSPTTPRGGLSINAVDALNIVRSRANMPNVTAAATGYSSFMELVRNERWVELGWEGHLWYDIRRWYIAHEEEKDIYTLKFDKDYANVTRQVVGTRIFENPRHYWMPIPLEQTQIYKEYSQNPGW